MRIIIAALLLICLTACVDMPKKTTQVIDDRPLISFDTGAWGKKAAGLTFWVDGIAYGAVNQYLVNDSALRIIPGRHLIQIRHNDVDIFSQEVVLGERTTRIIKVPPYE